MNTYDPFRKTPALRSTWGNALRMAPEDSGTMRFDAPQANTPGMFNTLGSWGGPAATAAQQVATGVGQQVGALGAANQVANGVANAVRQGGQQTAQGFRVNVPSGYGQANSYYYNGHAVQGDQGQHITLPVAYNEAADTRRWEFNGTPQESTMRRAVRYAYDDVQGGKATDFNAALMARLTQFYNEAGGQGVGYTLPNAGTQKASGYRPMQTQQTQEGAGGMAYGPMPIVPEVSSYWDTLKRLAGGVAQPQRATGGVLQGLNSNSMFSQGYSPLNSGQQTTQASGATPYGPGSLGQPLSAQQTAAAASQWGTGATTPGATPLTATGATASRPFGNAYIDDAGAGRSLGDPELMELLLNEALGRGGQPNRRGKLANWRDDWYTAALMTLANLGDDTTGQGLTDLLNQTVGNIRGGTGLSGQMRAAGQRAMGEFNPLEYTEPEEAMQQLGFIRSSLGYGSGPMAVNRLDYNAQNLEDQYSRYKLLGHDYAPGATDFFTDNPLGDTEYYKLLQRLAAQR